MKKFLVCGNYGASNLGDEALLDGILGFLRAVDEEAQITVMSAHPQETIELHKVKSVAFIPSGFRSLFSSFGGGFAETFRAFKEADVFILGGGGLFTDEKFRAVFIWYIQARFALFLKKPLFCLGQSVGPLQTRLGRFLAKKIFRRATVLSVRDKASAELLQQLGVEHVKVLADPAFSLSENIDLKDLPMVPFDQREKYVVVSVRPWLEKEQRNQSQELARFIDWLYEKYGLKTVFVPFQILYDNDVLELEKIMGKLQNPDAAQMFEYSANYRKVLELFARARAVVGMRLHSLIFASLTTTPFVALSYSQKVSALVTDLGFEQYLVEWKHLDLNELEKKFELLWRNSPLIEVDLLKNRKIFCDLTKENIKLLVDLIHNTPLPAENFSGGEGKFRV